MSTAGLLLPPQLQFVDANGAPLAGGLLYCYVPGTLTPKNSWQDSAETIFNTNPITLDVRGTCVLYGEGDYRLILTDAIGNQIFDLLSSEPLPASAIGVIGNCLGASTFQQFMDCAGITAAIAAAVGNVELEPGPQGVQGPTGPQGVQGPTGPAGASASFSFSLNNPGYILLGPYGSAPLINFGFNASDATGHANGNYGLSFTNSVIAWVGTCAAPEGIWVNPTSTGNTSWSAVTMSPYAPGSTFTGPIGFGWIAIGS